MCKIFIQLQFEMSEMSTQILPEESTQKGEKEKSPIDIEPEQSTSRASRRTTKESGLSRAAESDSADEVFI